MKILDALLVLKEQAVKGCVGNHACGICYNLSGLTGDSDLSYTFVSNNSEDWEQYSGVYGYPVLLSNDCDLWEGEQLQLRLSLIDHLIAKAKILES